MCFVPLPGLSSSGDQVLGECTVPGGQCILITSLVPATWFPGCTARQVWHVSPLGSWIQAANLLADDSCPGSQEDVIGNWEPAQDLVEDAGLWGGDWSSPLPFGSGCCMPASLPLVGWREEPVHCWIALLWYLRSPLFCEQVRLSIRVFCGKVLFFSSLEIPQFGLLSHFSSLRLSTGHSGPVLTLSTDCAACISLSSPCSLVAKASVWATSPLAVAFRHVFCGFCFYFVFSFFSWLCCPLRFQNSPQTHLWEGFLLFGNFSSFTTLSPEWVSVPKSFVSFCLLYFVLPSFEQDGLPFWVPGVLRQRSEVVLWKLLSIQMIFWWILGGESGLSNLSLCHHGPPQDIIS